VFDLRVLLIESTDYGENNNAVNDEKASFAELEEQIKKHLEILCANNLVPTQPTRQPQITHHTERERAKQELDLPDTSLIELEVQNEVAQALMRSVRGIKPTIITNVSKMSTDYHAARNALAAMKKLKEILNLYKRCWQREPQDRSDAQQSY